MTDTLKTTLAYYQDRQCAIQWREFLSALAAEFESQLGASELRELLRRIGDRFATNAPLDKCDTLDELQDAINATWTSIDWGWVSISETQGQLMIQHFAAPLRAAFGESSDAWAAGYLEGAYQRWFDALGIDPELRMRETDRGADDEMQFILAR